VCSHQILNKFLQLLKNKKKYRKNPVNTEKTLSKYDTAYGERLALKRQLKRIEEGKMMNVEDGVDVGDVVLLQCSPSEVCQLARLGCKRSG